MYSVAVLFIVVLICQPILAQTEAKDIKWEWNYSQSDDIFIDLIGSKATGFWESNTPNIYGGELKVTLPSKLSFKEINVPVFLFENPEEEHLFQVYRSGNVAVLSLRPHQLIDVPLAPKTVKLNKKAIKGKLKGLQQSCRLTFSSVDVKRVFKSPVTGRTYSLVFNDEFNDGKIDVNRWDTRANRAPFTRRGQYKGSPYYVLCHNDWNKEINGTLRLEVSKYPFQSNVVMTGGLLSAGRFMTRYGYYETKASFRDCQGEGYWPAFWLAFDHKDKYNGGVEVDIIEYIPKSQQLFHTLHWYKKTPVVKEKKEVQHAAKSYDPVHKKNEHRSSTKHYKLNDAMTKDHIIALEWTPDELIFYIDGEVVRRVNKSKDPAMIPSAYEMVYFSCSGGEWGGHIMKNLVPAYVYFDYCRCYQEAEQDAYYTVDGVTDKVAAKERNAKL